MNRKLPIALLLSALSMPLAAQQDERPGFLNEALAVEIEADEAELSEERDVSVYRGNVRLKRGPLTMHGEQLRVERDPASGQIEARLSGSPATAEHQAADGGPPVIASASQIVYTTIIEVLELAGNARIQRGEDELQGDSVRYDVANARIQADGGKERVRIVINPPSQTSDEP